MISMFAVRTWLYSVHMIKLKSALNGVTTNNRKIKTGIKKKSTLTEILTKLTSDNSNKELIAPLSLKLKIVKRTHI